AEDRVLRTLLKIEFDYGLAVVNGIRLAIGNLTACIVRLGQVAIDKLHGHGIQEVRIDTVVYKRSFERDGSPRIAFPRCERREIPAHHRGCRTEPLEVGRILPDRRALIPAEEEQFVLEDRAADGTAKLISFQGTSCSLPGGGLNPRENICGVEQVVT